MSEPSIIPVERYVQELWDRDATDLLFTAGAPPLMRIDGALTPMAGAAPLPRRHRAHRPRHPRRASCGARSTATRRSTSRSAGPDSRASGPTRSTSAGRRARAAPDPVRDPDVRRARPAARGARISSTLPQGLVLVTGPTGSGKSTTLASMIDSDQRRTAPCHILTIEDPIEYVHSHKRSTVNQREVGIDTRHRSSGRLRSAFREDPDVAARRRDARPRDDRSRSRSPRPATSCSRRCTPTTPRRRSTASSTCSRPNSRRRSGCSSRARSQAIVSQRLVPRIGGGMVAAFEVLVATYAVRNIVRDGKTNQLRNLIATGAKDGMQTLEIVALGARGGGAVSTTRGSGEPLAAHERSDGPQRLSLVAGSRPSRQAVASCRSQAPRSVSRSP